MPSYLPFTLIPIMMRVVVMGWLILLSGTLQAATPPYVLSLEWPVTEEGTHVLRVQDQTGVMPLTGVVHTNIIRYDDVYRQYLVLSPDLARCGGSTQWIFDLELPPGSIASLHLSQTYSTLGHWPKAEAAFSGHSTLIDLSAHACPSSSDEVGDERIVGELTLAVDRPAAGTSLWEDVGHAWIEFRALHPDARVALPMLTLGTYSNVLRDGATSGLNLNRELGRVPDVYKTMPLNADQLAKVFMVVQHYQVLGADAWTLEHNCTGFATTVWQATTGEVLSATQTYPGATWEVLLLGLPNTASLYHTLKASPGSVLLEQP